MKLTKEQAVAFLKKGLGFKKASQWDADKIKSRLAQVPDKVTEEDVAEGYGDLYKKICDAKGVVEITEDEKPEKETKAEKPEKVEAKPEKKGAKKPAAKAATASTKEVKRDKFGCRIGSISAKVNAAVSDEWQTEEQIAKAAGVSLDQARGRIYYAIQDGLMESERAVRVKFAKQPAKK